MIKRINTENKKEEICTFEQDLKKHLDKMKVMDDIELNKFLENSKVEEEFKF